MKKLHFLLSVAVITVLAACHIGGGRHTTIVENSNGTSIKIEYKGQTYFNGDSNAIKAISPHGYVKYERNGRELMATSNSGQITYEIDGGEKQTKLNHDDRNFLAQAIKDMVKLGHNADGR